MNWTSFIDEMNDDLRELNKTLPETTKAFSALTRAAKDGGVLDLRTKEFVAIAIAVATRCDPCIGFHVRALAKAGGTREELADVLAMSIQMGGGPSLMYAAKALAAWDQLTA